MANPAVSVIALSCQRNVQMQFHSNSKFRSEAREPSARTAANRDASGKHLGYEKSWTSILVVYLANRDIVDLSNRY